MPDKRQHRGPNPKDAIEFSESMVPRLRNAVADVSWLLGRGYAPDSTLKLVGDRYGLTARQRKAVTRVACDDAAAADRIGRMVAPDEMRGKKIAIDGYNLLITVEAALSGGVVLCGRDSTFRDMASMHGNYRSIAETVPALEIVGRYLEAISVSSVRWLLDEPVSNSGKLRKKIEESALLKGWEWTVDLVADPDSTLVENPGVIASADSRVLDGGGPWLNLARLVIEKHVPRARVLYVD